MKLTNPRWAPVPKFHSLKIGLALLLCVAASTTKTALAEEDTPAAEPDPKDKAELLQMEERFGAAVEKRDPAALAEILAEYYSDAVEGAKKALTKRGAIERLNAGRLSFYRIEKDLKTRHSADIFTVTGLAKATPPGQDSEKKPEKKWIHVRRYWTKKDGRWLLVGQAVGPWAKAEKETKKE